MHFEQIFQQISPESIPEDVFTLVGKIFPVITAGRTDHFNSMTASGGGFGMLFKKPVAWCILKADRYTLELIQKEQAYTLSFFPEAFKKHVYFFGSASGRGSDKMEKVELTATQTPSGCISYQAAGLIIECKLTMITMPDRADFYSQEAKDYIKEAYKMASDYRKFVFGEITNVWQRKTHTIRF